jgi:hypothetical protein
MAGNTETISLRPKFSLDSSKSRANIKETNKVWLRIMETKKSLTKSNVAINLQKLTKG